MARRWRSIGLPAVLLLAALLGSFPACAVDNTWERPPTANAVQALYARLFPNGQFRRSYALVIGIGDYNAFGRLNAPTRDALRVADFLRRDVTAGGAGFDHVVTLTDADATKERIERLMQTDFPARVHASDRFLFYFSGHGATRHFSDGTARGHLVLKRSGPGHWDEMIAMTQISEWAQNLGDARHVLFVLDACFSGLAAYQAKGASPREITLDRLSQPSSYLMTAGADLEESYSYNGESLFTQAFLAAAGGHFEPPANGIVSLDDLIARINRYIDAERARLGSAIRMTPQLFRERIKDNEGQFFFILPRRAEAEVATVTAAVQRKNAADPQGPPPAQPAPAAPVPAAGGGSGSAAAAPAPQQRAEPGVFKSPDVIFHLAVLPNGHLATGGKDGTVRVWDLARRDQPIVFVSRSVGEIHALTALPDGRVVSLDRAALHVWDERQPGAAPLTLPLNSDQDYALGVLPDGRIVAPYDGEGRVVVWKPGQGARPTIIGPFAQGTVVNEACAFTVLPDGRVGAAFRSPDELWLLDPDGHVQPSRFAGYEGKLSCELASMHDGRLVWRRDSGSSSEVRVQGLAASARPVVFKVQTAGWPDAFAVLPGDRVAIPFCCSGLKRSTVQVLDPAHGSKPLVLRGQGHAGAISALVALPDGRIATADDQTVRVWDPVRQAESLVLEGHSERIRSLAVLVDGLLVSGADDHTLRVWDVGEARGAPPP